MDQTVRPRLTLVNSLVREMDKTAGRRLERYIKARWGRDKGGIRGLCAQASFVPETIYSWFRGETEPSLDSLAELARILEVNRSEILAAMDGVVAAVPLDDDLRELIASEVERQVSRVLAEGPRQRPPGRTGAA